MTRYKFNEIEFRLVSVEEIDRFIGILQTRRPDAEEFVFNELTENKYDIDTLDAGTVLLVIAVAIRKSGFARDLGEIADIVDSTAKRIGENILYTIFYTNILKAQPSIGIVKLKEMSLNELIESFVLSELILTGQVGTLLNTKKIREALAKENQTKLSSGASYVSSNEIDHLKMLLEKDEFERQMG